MKKALLYSLILMVLVSAPSYGQAKVGTTGGSFLSYSPSVRANGMGTAGVALTGYGGSYFNPALLGLFALSHRGAVSVYPQRADYSLVRGQSLPYDYQLVALSLPREWRPWPNVTMGVAFYQTRQHLGTAIERTWSQGTILGTGRVIEFQDWASHWSASLAYGGPVRVAVGLTYKSVHQELGRYEAKTHAFDYGLAASVPLGRCLGPTWLGGRPVLTPTVGVAWNNDGPDMELFGNAYALPSIRRLGAALELGIDHPGQPDNWRLFDLTASIEHEKHSTGFENSFKVGGELGIADALHLRAGRVEFENSSHYHNTVGFGVNSRGLLHLAFAVFGEPSSGKFLREVAQFVSVEFSYAHRDMRWTYSGDVSFYELALVFQ